MLVAKVVQDCWNAPTSFPLGSATESIANERGRLAAVVRPALIVRIAPAAADAIDQAAFVRRMRILLVRRGCDGGGCDLLGGHGLGPGVAVNGAARCRDRERARAIEVPSGATGESKAMCRKFDEDQRTARPCVIAQSGENAPRGGRLC